MKNTGGFLVTQEQAQKIRKEAEKISKIICKYVEELYYRRQKGEK